MKEIDREMVVQKAREVFPDRPIEEIMDILDLYGKRSFEAERDRVHMGILEMCEGDLRRLKELVEFAKVDYRDLLMNAEYSEYKK